MILSNEEKEIYVKYENGFWFIKKLGVWFPAGKTAREALYYRMRMEGVK